MMLETLLRRQKRRHLFDLHLVTPEPFLGHFGVNGIGNLSRMMKDEFRSRHLNWTTERRAHRVEPGKATLADGAELPFDLAVLIPAFYGAQVVRDVDGLGNPRGFVPVDRQLRSTPTPTSTPSESRWRSRLRRQRPCRRRAEDRPHVGGDGARAAANIAAEVTGAGELVDGLALPCDVRRDAGDIAFYIRADPFLPRAMSLRCGGRPLPLPEARLRALLPREDEAGPALAALRLVSVAGPARAEIVRPTPSRSTSTTTQHADRPRVRAAMLPFLAEHYGNPSSAHWAGRRRRRPSRTRASRSPPCSAVRRARSCSRAAAPRRTTRRSRASSRPPARAAAHRHHARSSIPRSSSPAASWSGTAWR